MRAGIGGLGGGFWLQLPPTDALLCCLGAPSGMGVEPFSVARKPVERQRNLTALVSFGATRQCPGISQEPARDPDRIY
jgi:hypothetical protein